VSNQNSLRKWDWSKVQEVLRIYGPNIGELARRGDPLSKKVIEYYDTALRNPTSVEDNFNLRDCFEDWMRRHLTVGERIEMASRYGYLVDSEAGVVH
jgi:hypothetical protein